MKWFDHNAGRLLRAFCFALAALPLILCSLALAPAASAQAFKLQGGTSTLFDGHGGSLEVRGANYTGRLGFGLIGDRPHVGFFFATKWRNILWTAGDQLIPFTLPTDVFSHSYYFLARGAGAAWKDGHNAVFLFAGATSKGFATPFLNLAEADTGTALLFYDRKLPRDLRFVSRNILSRRQTSIQSLEWSPGERFKFGLSAGLGNNQRHWATSFDFVRTWIEVQASYTHAGDSFRRICVEAPVVTETDRENIRIEFKPWRVLQFAVSRNNYLAPPDSSQPVERAAVNGFSAWSTLAGLHLHGSFFDSRTQGGRSRALNVGARRGWWNRVEASVNYLRGAPARGPAFHSVVSTVREVITPRLSFSQTVTSGNGQTSIAFGGNFLSNLLTIGVEYQTIYVPFATSNQSPFKQVIAANLRLRLTSGMEVNGSTDVTPFGQVRYTAYATGFAYRGVSYPSGGASAGGRIHNFVVRGRVRDAEGQPVRGAALKIDNEVVFTDSQGEFFTRLKKAKDCEIDVLLDQFILPGSFQVLSAPKSVRAAREETAEMYEVVLMRTPVAGPANLGPTAAPVFGSGTNAQNDTVLRVPRLALSGRFSRRWFSPVMAPRMPLKSAAADSRHGRASNKAKIPVGSYIYYPADGSGPVDLGAVKVRHVEWNVQRHPGGADSGKRQRGLAGAARPATGPAKRVASQPRRAAKHDAPGAGPQHKR